MFPGCGKCLGSDIGAKAPDAIMSGWWGRGLEIVAMVGLMFGVEVAAAPTGGSYKEGSTINVGLLETGTKEGGEVGGDETVGELV